MGRSLGKVAGPRMECMSSSESSSRVATAGHPESPAEEQSSTGGGSCSGAIYSSEDREEGDPGLVEEILMSLLLLGLSSWSLRAMENMFMMVRRRRRMLSRI